MTTVPGRILIADDDQDMVQLLGRLVHREGLTPLLAKDGKEALQLVRAEDPDVLLADLRMPGMDGMELMRKAKDLEPDLPRCRGRWRRSAPAPTTSLPSPLNILKCSAFCSAR